MRDAKTITRRAEGRPALSIVICTFHREKLLERALERLMAQTAAVGSACEIIIVDNSDAGTAAGVVVRAADKTGQPIRWMEAHPANISVARNAGIAAAAAPFIAFLDDDQEVDEGWLDAVLTAIGSHPDFDGFFGAVEARFETPHAATPATQRLFSRHLDEADGFEVFAMGAGKTRSISLATNNSVLRRAALIPRDDPFDHAFGRGGGEDYDLFCRMQAAGSRFAWMPHARVSEFVPADRCDPAYLRRRFYAGGQAYAAAIANTSAYPMKMRWILRMKALAQAVLVALDLPRKIMAGRNAYLDYTYAVAGILGKMSFGAIHPIYDRKE